MKIDMDISLGEIEVRILGSLIEKELTTPEYYPLTLNSLTAACSQKSNRNPVMNLKDTDVARGLDRLRRAHLAWETQVAGSRTPRYEHNVQGKWRLDQQATAVLCVLLLRGPQTLGELRSRTGRMFEFKDLREVEAVLQGLAEGESGPLVVELPRLPGHKESRFMHLLAGEPDMESVQVALAPEPAVVQIVAENERIEDLEREVQVLRDELAGLKTRFEDFKKQFE